MQMRLSALLSMKADGTQQIQRDTQAIANNLSSAQQSADKLSKKRSRGVRDLAGDREGLDPREHRATRAAAGLRGAAGRDFAGMAQAGGQTSGIVAAYATVAANIFALTAAFKALSDAAKTVQLQKGLEQLGATSGKTLSIVAKDMERISGFGITSAEAMKSVASATAAGFKPDEIERLTRVAKGASTALGRDLSDSMDRLTRGTIKLEPELLDELGIMTRLNDATRVYAQQNNKAISSLTQTERRQAFLNAVLAEGEQKFGDIADNVPISSYDKLAASVRKFGTETLSTTNGVLNPFLDALIAVPALGLLPLMGMLKTATGKLIPDMNAHIGGLTSKLERLSRISAIASRGPQRILNRINEASIDSISAPHQQALARYAGSQNRSGEFLQENAVKFYKSALDMTKRQAILTKERDDLSIKQKREELALTSEITKQLERQLRKAQREGVVAATGQNIARTNALSIRAQRVNADKFQQDLIMSAGSPVATMRSIFTAMGRDIGTAFSLGERAARKHLAGIRRELDTNTVPAIHKMGAAFIGVGTTIKGMGALIGTAFQGLQAASGILFTFIALSSAFQLIMSFFESDLDKKLKAIDEEINSIADNMGRTAKEIAKMNQVGNISKGVEAATNSISELSTKLREYSDELANAAGKENSLGFTSFLTKKFDIGGGIGDAMRAGTAEGLAFSQTSYEEIFTTLTGEQILKQLGLDDKTTKYVGNTIDVLAQGFGQDMADKYLAAIRANPEKVAEITQEFDKALKPGINMFTDLGTSITGANDALRKMQTPAFLESDYLPVSQSISQISKSLDTINRMDQANFLTEEATDKMRSSLAETVLSSRELAIELEYLSKGSISIVPLVDEYNRLKIAIAQANEAGKDTTGLVAELDKIKRKIDVVGIAGLADEAALQNSIQKLTQANIEMVKLQQRSSDILANIRRGSLSIEQTGRKITALQRLGAENTNPKAAALEEIKAAELDYKLKMEALKERERLIDLEYKLEDIKRIREIEAQKRIAIDEFGTFSKSIGMYGETAQVSRFEAFKRGETIPGLSEADRVAMENTIKYLNILESMSTTYGSIARGNKNAARQEVETAKIALDLAMQKFYALDHENNKLKENYAQQEKMLGLEKERLSIRKSLSDLSLQAREFTETQAARARNEELSPQAIFELEKTKALNAINMLEEERKMLVAEHSLKMANLKLEAKIKQGEMTLLRDELIAQSLTTGLSPEQFTFLDSLEVDLQDFIKSTAEFIKLQNQNNFAAQWLLAAQKRLAQRELEAKETPQQAALKDMAIENKTRARQAGLGANFFTSMMSPEVAAIQSDYAAKYDKIFSADEIQRMAVEQAMFNAQLDAGNKLAQSIGQSFSEAFQGLVQGTITAEQAFKQMGISMLQTLAQIYMEMLAIELVSIFTTGGKAAAGGVMPAKAAAGGIMRAAGGGIMSKKNYTPMAYGGIMPMATGGVMSRSTPVQGIITKPTYLVGEGKYDEAVVPLPNGRDIPVQLHGSSGSNNVNVNVNIASNGDTQVSGNDGQNLGAAVARAVQKELLAQKAPGGILNKYGVA